MKNTKKFISIISVIVIIAMLSLLFVACNPDSYESRLTSKGYKDIKIYTAGSTPVDNFNANAKGEYKGALEWQLVASKGIDTVYIFKFEKIKDAKTFEKGAATNYGEFVDRQSSVVLIGTPQSVKDAK